MRELDLGEVQPADVDESAPSIDEVLSRTKNFLPSDHVRDSDLLTRRRRKSSAPLLGKVIKRRSLDFPGRVLVRWRDEEGADHERWLTQVRGLGLSEGDEVLLTKPGNKNHFIVTGAIQKGDPQESVVEMNTKELEENLDVHVDGGRLELEAREEVVLRCGEAAITLRKNGRVEILGTYVETYSKGTNRIKGGTVQIN